MSLFAGLSGLGLGSFKDKKIYEDNSNTKEEDDIKGAQTTLSEKDYLFEKTYTCPVCDKKFKALTVRAGKARLISQDEDLRPHYDGIDTIKYDVIFCNHCGFAAISKGFQNLTSLQRKNIKEQVSSQFRPIEESPQILSYDDAILRHKIALLCSTVKNAKNSEKAYTCLKLGWLVRTKMEQMDVHDEEYIALENTLKECYQNAYEGFQQAFSKETFPMMGMEEMTVTYVMAVLAVNLEKYNEAAKLLSRVITGHNTGPRLKDKALALKDRIKEELAERVKQEGMS